MDKEFEKKTEDLGLRLLFAVTKWYARGYYHGLNNLDKNKVIEEIYEKVNIDLTLNQVKQIFELEEKNK